MRKFSTLAIAAIAAFSAGTASADTVQLTNFAFPPAQTINVSGAGSLPDYSGGAGEFTGTLNGASFLTYCTDLSQTFSFGTTYTDYHVISGASYWGATKSADLDRLFSAAGAAVNDPVSSAVFQAAVWEIIYETPGNPYGFTTGDMTFTASGSTQTALNAADALFPLLASQPITVHVDKLFSDGHQDFLVLTPVPEPSTYAMLVLGLAGVGFSARRRMKRD